jgi:hypothetical protein
MHRKIHPESPRGFFKNLRRPAFQRDEPFGIFEISGIDDVFISLLYSESRIKQGEHDIYDGIKHDD